MKYRKTVLIYAVQWHPGTAVHGVCVGDRYCHIIQDGGLPLNSPHVHTLEGPLTVSPGDWIAGPGARGEFWPIKPDVFAATYTQADDKCPPATTSRLTEELAAAQATIARLREALMPLAEHGRVCRALRPGHGGRIASIHSAHTPDGDHTLTWGHCDAAARALSLPHDRTALDAALADARREGAREAARACLAAANAAHAGLTGNRPYHTARVVVGAVEAEAARIDKEGA